MAVMVLMALYGIAKAISKTAVWLWRPKRPRLTVTLRLNETTEDVEQQVRFAYFVAKEQHLPLTVIEDGADEDTVCMARRVLRGHELGTDEKKLSTNACAADQTRV